MRIKFKKISRSTNLDRTTLIYNIMNALDRPRYDIVRWTEKSIEFKSGIWDVGVHTGARSYIDGVRFEIDQRNKTIYLSYYYSPAVEIIANSIALAAALFKDYHFFYFNVFLLIMGLIRFIRMRWNAAELLEKISNQE